MTREEFIEGLEHDEFRFEINGDRIIIYGGPYEWNQEFIDMDEIKSIPDNVEFINDGHLNLNSLIKIPKGTEFMNGGDIFLDKVEQIDSDVVFNNSGKIFLLFKGKDIFDNYEGRSRFDKFFIDKIDDMALFNLMIRRGIFS